MAKFEEKIADWMPLRLVIWRKGTAFFSPAERGAYMDLILAYWELGPLPNDDAILQQLARVTDSRTWKQVRGKVLGKFNEIDGMLTHARIDEERTVALQKFQRKSDAGRVAGQASAQARAKQTSTTGSTNRSTVGSTTGQPDVHTTYQGHSSIDETDANASVGRKRQPPKRSTALPADWKLSQEGFDHATAKGLDPATVRAIAEHFRDDNAAKGRTSKDWNASWRTWITKHIGWYGTGPWPKGKQLVSNRQGPESVIAAGAAVIARLQADSGLRRDGGCDVDEAPDFGDGASDPDGFADGPYIDATDEPERDRRVAYPNEA